MHQIVSALIVLLCAGKDNFFQINKACSLQFLFDQFPLCETTKKRLLAYIYFFQDMHRSISISNEGGFTLQSRPSEKQYNCFLFFLQTEQKGLTSQKGHPPSLCWASNGASTSPGPDSVHGMQTCDSRHWAEQAVMGWGHISTVPSAVLQAHSGNTNQEAACQPRLWAKVCVGSDWKGTANLVRRR